MWHRKWILPCSFYLLALSSDGRQKTDVDEERDFLEDNRLRFPPKAAAKGIFKKDFLYLFIPYLFNEDIFVIWIYLYIASIYQ